MIVKSSSGSPNRLLVTKKTLKRYVVFLQHFTFLTAKNMTKKLTHIDVFLIEISVNRNVVF